jgi:sialidase-1
MNRSEPMLLPTLALLLGLCVLPARADDASLELTGGTTIVNKVGGWPSFVTLKDGSILAAKGRTWHRSVDGGRSWTGPEERLACPSIHGGIRSIIRLNSGLLGVILVRMGGLPNLCRDEKNFRQMWLWFSTSADEGQTWSAPVQMNRYFTFGNPHVASLIQTKSGRLVLPVRAGFAAGDAVRSKAGAYGTVDGERRRVGGHTTYPEMDITFCYLSDDEGKTWHKSSGYIFGWDLKLGSFPCDEPVVIELKDSRLMLLARSTIGQLYRVTSSDGGDNWGIAEPSGIVSAYAPCMIRRIPTTDDLLLIWNQASREEIESGYERNRLSVAISKDEGRSWSHAKTLFRSHLPAVGLMKPGPVTGNIGIRPFVGELPRDFATADYPNIHFHGDDVLLHYDRNPKFLGGAYWTLRIFPISALYE